MIDSNGKINTANNNTIINCGSLYAAATTGESIYLGYDSGNKIIFNNNATVAFFDFNGHMQSNFVIASALSSLKQKFPNNVILDTESLLENEFLIEQDLMIVSLESWKDLLDTRPVWLSGVPSVLIIKP